MLFEDIEGHTAKYKTPMVKCFKLLPRCSIQQVSKGILIIVVITLVWNTTKKKAIFRGPIKTKFNFFFYIM